MSDIERSKELAVVAARAAAQKLGSDLVAIDVHEQTVFADVFLMVSGDTPRQVRAIVNHIDEEMTKHEAAPKSIEGADDYQWVLMECPGVIVHVFESQRRAYFELERLWKDCPEVPLPDFEAEASAAALEHQSEAPQIIGLD